MKNQPMSVHEQAQIRKHQADAKAKAQAWGLTVHACATRTGHPHAPEMMADELRALTASGGIELVVEALGDLLADTLGAPGRR